MNEIYQISQAIAASDLLLSDQQIRSDQFYLFCSTTPEPLGYFSRHFDKQGDSQTVLQKKLLQKRFFSDTNEFLLHLKREVF
jgi:hypothetical protein